MITLDMVKKDLKEIVSKVDENYVYPQNEKREQVGYEGPICSYVFENRPSCIVGVWAHKNGVPIETLKDYEGSSARQLIEHVFPSTIIDPKAIGLLGQIQNFQDAGVPWHEVLRKCNVWI